MRDLNLNVIQCPNPVLWREEQARKAEMIEKACVCSCSYASPIKIISTPENPPMLVAKNKKTFMRNSVDCKSCKKRLF